MSSIHLTTLVVNDDRATDDPLRLLLDAALTTWTRVYGRPERGTTLILLWCGPDAYPPARGAPRAVVELAHRGPTQRRDLIITDDAAAATHPRVWCEVERSWPR